METVNLNKDITHPKLNIPIKGFQKTSLIDYPGKISSIIFLGGCNFRCRYCYNPELVFRHHKIPTIEADYILSQLNERKKYIDGVVITGGEPTLYNNLPLLIKEIKKLGYYVKLDTNGTNPSMLIGLLKNNLVDYIAMDMKAPLPKYGDVAGIKINMELLEASICIILHSSIDYEFRTTLIKEELQKKDIIEIAKTIRGARRYCLQQFKNNVELVDNSFKKKTAYSKEEMEEFKDILMPYFDEVIVRYN